MTSILTANAESIANTTTFGSQYYPQITSLSDGGYVVMWGGSTGVAIQRYDASGHRVGSEVAVAGSTGGFPVVAGLADGGWVVVWNDNTNIMVERFDSNGSSSAATAVAAASNQMDKPQVAGLATGGFVVTWTNLGGDGSGYGVLAQNYDAGGYKIGSAIVVDTTISGDQTARDVAAFSDGGYVVVWQDIAGQQVYTQRFDASGAKIGGETLVGVDGYMATPGVAVLSDDSYVVTWATVTSIEMLHYSAAGTLLGNETKVNTTDAFVHFPRITALDDGGYVIVYEANTEIYAQRFDASGDAIGSETHVNTYTAGTQTLADVTGLPGGGYAVTWVSVGQDGDQGTIIQKSYTAADNLNGTQYLYGTADADMLDGGAGGDWMYGGQGDDVYYVNSASDRVVENAGEGYDEVRSTISFSLGANVENLTLLGTAKINGYGNELDNIITGSAGANALNGGSGDDTIYGSDGNDTIDTGSGNDTAFGGNGDDVIYGLLSTSVALDGGAGNDTLYGSIGDDTIYGGDGNDILFGNDGLGATDSIDGGAGNDKIYTGEGTKYVDGGAGSDTFYISDGLLFISGGDGFDTIDATGLAATGLMIDLASGLLTAIGTVGYLSGIETVVGSAFDDVLIGDGGGNTLNGGAGDDVIDGGAGNVRDTLWGGGGNDTASYASSTAGVTVSLNLQDADQDTGGAGIDYLDGFRNLTGSKFADILTGDGNGNVLDGGKGNDTLYGGAGNDTYIVDSTSDVASEQIVGGTDDGGTDLVMSSADYTLGAFIENLTLTGVNNRNGTGNGLDNVVTGNSGHNILKGLGGADWLDGGGSSDTLYGGAGDDTYVVDVSTDKVREDTVAGVDDGGHDKVISYVTYTLTAFVEDLDLMGSAVNGSGNNLDNHINGNAGDNSLLGYGGNDVLDGGLGADRMYGGSGNDTYYVNDSGDKVIEDKTTGTDDGGTDTVMSSISYILGNFVENLTLIGTGNFGGAGNALNNIIIGNNGGNILTGNGGNDTLTGGLGHDTFSFSAAAANGLDHLTDFVSGTDRLRFKGSDYGFATGHVLTSAELQVNSTGAASGGTHQFIYNTTNHTLYWDSDGTGATAAIALAVFDNAATPATGDFLFT